jgi:hypothetical protein
VATGCVWLGKALSHLAWSVRRVAGQEPCVATMDDATLQEWEALVARFARASDLFIQKVLRSAALAEDPAWRGTLRDTLQLAEKRGWIESAETWLEIRELRNLAMHEYGGEAVDAALRRMRDLCPVVVATRDLWTRAPEED